MPRITDSYSSPMDFCRFCFPDEADAEEQYSTPVPDSENDGRGNCFEHNSPHPWYEGDDYTCHACGKQLTEEDE